MNKLINSAMMPSLSRDYTRDVRNPLTAEQFAHILRAEPFESFIGYPETARILQEISGLKIAISRAQTSVEPGDKLLIMRLRYRLDDPARKGQTVHTIEDFEFGVYVVE